MISFFAKGPFSNLFASAMTPMFPSFSAGQTLVYATGCFISGLTLATPSGWTRWDDGGTTNNHVFALTSITGAESIPAVSWGAGAFAWAIGLVYNGVMSAASAVDTTASNHRGTTSAENIVGLTFTVTPAQSNTMMLFSGMKNKLAASNSSTFTAPANYTIRAQQTLAGSEYAVCIGDWIQSAAASTPANIAYAGSVPDGTAQSMQSQLIAIKPGAATFAPYPPQRRSRVAHTLYYPD
jgi:hypothetical protein